MESMSKEISNEEARDLIERGAKVIDVREPEEFEKGHIPDSVSVPMDEFTANLGKLEDQEPLILVCERGESSRQAGMLLEAYGGVKSDEVYNLSEGLNEWDGDLVSAEDDEKRDQSSGNRSTNQA